MRAWSNYATPYSEMDCRLIKVHIDASAESVEVESS
jgi:hypothetical protein